MPEMNKKYRLLNSIISSGVGSFCKIFIFEKRFSQCGVTNIQEMT